MYWKQIEKYFLRAISCSYLEMCHIMLKLNLPLSYHVLAYLERQTSVVCRLHLNWTCFLSNTFQSVIIYMDFFL